MTAPADEIRAHLVQIEGQRPQPLDRIDHQEPAVAMHRVGQRAQIEGGAGLKLDPGAGNDPGPGSDGRLKRGRIDREVRSRRDDVNLRARRFGRPMPRVGVRRVLLIEQDDLVSGPKSDAERRLGQGQRARLEERHVARLRAHEPGNAGARRLDPDDGLADVQGAPTQGHDRGVDGLGGNGRERRHAGVVEMERGRVDQSVTQGLERGVGVHGGEPSPTSGTLHPPLTRWGGARFFVRTSAPVRGAGRRSAGR